MKNYYRIMLGRKSVHAPECFAGNFIGADFDIRVDLSGKLPDQWRDFNKEFIPVYLARVPGKSKISAGLACGFLWTISKGIKTGDIVLSPDGSGQYRIGEVSGDYYYAPDGILPHRRSVHWLSQTIARADMSEALRNATGAIGTVSNITGHHEEIERLIGGAQPSQIFSTDETVEDPAAFAMEKHLEDFLVKNWQGGGLGSNLYLDISGGPGVKSLS
jgi:restriction system protein